MTELKTLLESKKESYLKALQDLIALDTQCIGHGIDGGKEKAGQDFMIQWMEKLNVDNMVLDQMEESVIQEAIETYGEGNSGHNYQNRYNVYATFKGTDSDHYRSILFNGHMDTMPPGNEKLWTYGPWNPLIYEGKINGLGSTDMKAGLLAPLLTIDLLKTADRMPKGDVKIISVVDEEGGGNGSIQAAMRGVTADAAVVCECTDYELILAHMGFVFFDIHLVGHAIHAGRKFDGASAIENMVKVMGALHELEHLWLARYQHPLLPPPSINVGEIQGGTAGSTVAKECWIRICAHYLPALMTRQQVEDEIIEAVRRIEASDTWMQAHPATLYVYQAGGGFEMEQDHDLIRTFSSVYKELMGEKVNFVGSPAGCDSRIWRNIAGIPTVQYGPGHIDQCHAMDEYLHLKDFWHVILMYALIIENWCNQKK